ncbi:phage Gp37/Gp68 family protein [Mesorhizobium sp. J428]|uniref:phage Gp37/Gp68 family protein n=1 Tax=Mesorhizobium sp. J428 TaxID=2898440 RepID=UPI00215177AA|nr:phage Gp37/Gp68 family protein [Mesorhizobium sp. J428]MCR5855958.1 phage Gp37/Gp68 family protein [Mesorhizobium sp. J428]
MADGTAIEWTDATWNPVTGCQVTSPGCRFCYAMKLAGTRLRNHPSREGLTVETKNGPVWTGAVRFNEGWLDQPLRWTKPRKIFVCAHADLFYDAVPDEWIDRAFAVMALAQQHTFQVLTKRPDRMCRYIRAGRRLTLSDGSTVSWDKPLANVWLGTSVEDQQRAEERRLPLYLVHAEGWQTWVSYEPALGPIYWDGWEFIRWLVAGGESDMDGVSARPSHPHWHRLARNFCAAHGIAFDFKQWGSWAAACQMTDREVDALFGNGGACKVEEIVLRADGTQRQSGSSDAFGGYRPVVMFRVGKKHSGRLLDGRLHDAFPQGGAL